MATQQRPEAPLETLEARFRAQHPGSRSGFLLLDQNREALLARLALVDGAVHSLDLQYYLWFGDASGALMLEAALEAADRGVRVRLLMDDLQHVGADQGFTSIAAHPNLDLRLFNPFETRGPRKLLRRAIEFLSRVDRLNTRMHNKLLVADGCTAICGGRNVGDAYFGLSRSHNFHDLDLLAVGDSARELAQAFQTYWDSPSAPRSPRQPGRTRRLKRRRRRAQRRIRRSPELSDLLRARVEWRSWLDAAGRRLVVGEGRANYDRPSTAAVTDVSSMAGIWRALAAAEREVLLEIAYWVPNQRTVDYLSGLEARGVDVRFLTNSLASHDVPAVNSVYRRWRRAVIEAGVELFELRKNGDLKTLQETPPQVSSFIALHSKAFVVDRKVVYVGSHNLDPRSNELNTELGLFVESPELAAAVAGLIERDMRPENSWAVELRGKRLVWRAGDRVLRRQPVRHFWQRVGDVILGLLPIEDQL